MARVLLIEDNDDDRNIYKTLLYYNGFDVEVAPDGKTGIDAAVAAKPDLILIDVMLPGINGLVAAQRITLNPATSHIPILCMSAYDVSLHAVVHSGAREFLPKPVDPSELVRAIWRHLPGDQPLTVTPNGE